MRKNAVSRYEVGAAFLTDKRRPAASPVCKWEKGGRTVL